MLIDASLLFLLIVLNGVLALSEIAVIGSRKARLQQLADDGSTGAVDALRLAAEPTRFLSTVQVGITCLGILSGAIGEATVASRLRAVFEQIPAVQPFARPLSIAVLVVVLTYVSLIVGELVPKRIALTRPEWFASAMAKPMRWLSVVSRPLVALLSISTDSLLALFRIRTAHGPSVTPEEIRVLIDQGAAEGVFEQSEQQLVTNVLDLDERTVASLLTPRSDIEYLDLRDPIEKTREKVESQSHTILPLCDGGLEHVVGLVRSARLLKALSRGAALDLRDVAEPPLFVPHTMSLMRLLEHFKRAHLPVALVVDEFGDVDGLVSLMDVVSEIVGDLPREPGEEPVAVRREDGSWLVEGTTDIATAARHLDIDPEALGDTSVPPRYHTLAGLAMLTLGHVPRSGDVFTHGRFRIEVLDMDGRRVDKVLITEVQPPAGSSEAERPVRSD